MYSLRQGELKSFSNLYRHSPKDLRMPVLNLFKSFLEKSISELHGALSRNTFYIKSPNVISNLAAAHILYISEGKNRLLISFELD